MRFDLSQSGLKSVITAGIFSLVAIGILFNWAVPVSAQNAAPAKPDAPTLRALHQGMVEVDWNDVSGANRYEVQFYTSSGWIDLPNAGLGIEIVLRWISSGGDWPTCRFGLRRFPRQGGQ